MDEVTVVAPGSNGKMNELQAAYGMLQLKYVGGEIEKRLKAVSLYRQELRDVSGISMLDQVPEVIWNAAYFPIFVNEAVYGKTRDELYFALRKAGFYGRRYFYPLISEFSVYREMSSASPSHLPVATDVSSRVICLPLFAGISIAIIEKISSIVRA